MSAHGVKVDIRVHIVVDMCMGTLGYLCAHPY